MVGITEARGRGGVGNPRGLTMNVVPGPREGLVSEARPRVDPGPAGGRVSSAPGADTHTGFDLVSKERVNSLFEQPAAAAPCEASQCKNGYRTGSTLGLGWAASYVTQHTASSG